jgi:hypothetical protein
MGGLALTMSQGLLAALFAGATIQLYWPNILTGHAYSPAIGGLCELADGLLEQGEGFRPVGVAPLSIEASLLNDCAE